MILERNLDQRTVQVHTHGNTRVGTPDDAANWEPLVFAPLWAPDGRRCFTALCWDNARQENYWAQTWADSFNEAYAKFDGEVIWFDGFNQLVGFDAPLRRYFNHDDGRIAYVRGRALRRPWVRRDSGELTVGYVVEFSTCGRQCRASFSGPDQSAGK